VQVVRPVHKKQSLIKAKPEEALMKLNGYRLIFVVIGIVITVLVSSVLVSYNLHLPQGEKFSELYILGSNQSNYPFNVSAGQDYSIYPNVRNHLGTVTHYSVVVKLGSLSELLPEETSSTPNSLPVLYEYKFTLGDGQDWRGSLNFSFSNVIFESGFSQIGTIKINDVTTNIDKKAYWDSTYNGYYYQLVLELWLGDGANENFMFNNRFVTLTLNMTTPFGP
jgi:hypothetical protein